MSCSVEFSTPLNTNNDFSSSQSYNDLINYCSIRKQFNRIIPQSMTIQNKKLISKNKKFSSNIEEYRKYKQEIISLKESISLLREKKQKKLEQIEELRCLMRKVGNKNNSNNTVHSPIKYHNERESKEQRNNDQRFRCNSYDKKQRCFDCTTGKSDSVEGYLSLVPTTSDLSSGKDDDAAPEGGNYGESDAQCDFIISNDSSSSSFNNSDGWHRCCFGNSKENNKALKGLEEKELSLLEKGN